MSTSEGRILTALLEKIRAIVSGIQYYELHEPEGFPVQD
jgi:hypothetical protein